MINNSSSYLSLPIPDLFHKRLFSRTPTPLDIDNGVVGSILFIRFNGLSLCIVRAAIE